MPTCPRGHESQAADWCDFCGFPMSPPPGLPIPGVAGTGAPEVTAGLASCPICRTPQTGRYCEECRYDFELASATPPPTQAGGYEPPAPPRLSFEKPPQAPPAPPAPPTVPPAQQLPGFPEPDFESASGPVYASGSGDDFGTSFRLAPPVPASPPPPPARTNWIAVVSADRDYFTEMMSRSGPEASGLFFPPYCPERRIPITGRGQLRIGRRSQQRGTVPEIDLSVPPEDPGASHQHALLAEQPDGSWVLVDQDSTNGTTVNGGPDPIPPHTAIPLKDGDRIHIGAWTTITLRRA